MLQLHYFYIIRRYCVLLRVHFENKPKRYTEIFKVVKNENFLPRKFLLFFLFFAHNIDCGYTLEPPRQGGSIEYPQSMFWSKHKKNRYTPAYPSFTRYIKEGFNGEFIARTCFPDVYPRSDIHVSGQK